MRLLNLTALTAVILSTAAHAQQASQPNLMNPAISLDGLFAVSQFNRPDPLVFAGGHDFQVNGFNIQQIELSFNSNVDPYFRADANLVLTQAGIEIEEAYATSLDFPLDLQLRAGQFFTIFGRGNPMHPHAWDFADKPLILGRVFGGDGLRNPGVQLSWLTPLPWYLELIVSGQNSTGETATSFRGPTGAPMRSLDDALGLARLTSFLPLAEALSLNLGASALTGPNASADNTHTRIFGGDVFLKYRKPDSLSYVALTFEALERFYDTVDDGTTRDFGWYAALDWRADAPFERWHVGLRYDQVSARAVGAPPTTVIAPGSPDYDTGARWRISPVVTFYPSEFSKIRLQYEYDRPADFESAQQVVAMQLEFLIGAHGAHKF